MAVERKFIEDGILRFKITEFMARQLSRAGFSGLEIQKTPLMTLITAEVTNPGRVIGRKGRTINRITDRLRDEFSLDNPKINISSTSIPDLEPLVVARRLARLIEIGKNPRRMMHFMVKSIMKAGAIGCEVVISGKLGAKGGRARTFRSMDGYLPKAGEPARLVKQAHVTAYPKAGAIGVTVKIAPPGVQFPDKKTEVVEIKKDVSSENSSNNKKEVANSRYAKDGSSRDKYSRRRRLRKRNDSKNDSKDDVSKSSSSEKSSSSQSEGESN